MGALSPRRHSTERIDRQTSRSTVSSSGRSGCRALAGTEVIGRLACFSIDGLVREREASFPCESERRGWVADDGRRRQWHDAMGHAGVGRRSTAATRAGEERDASSRHREAGQSQGWNDRPTARSRSRRPTGSPRSTRRRTAVSCSNPAAAEVAALGLAHTRARHRSSEQSATIADCQARYDRVEDYTCTFYKRERIAGRMTPLHIMSMKVRTKPQSIYFKFQQPAHGREAIYIAGRHGGKVLAHDVGLNKILGRHACARAHLRRVPWRTAGIRSPRPESVPCSIPWRSAGPSSWIPRRRKLAFRDDMLVGPRRCTMIESTHPHRRPEFLHHMVRVYIDQELGLPIRFEAFDWPRHPGAEPELTEEYSYIAPQAQRRSAGYRLRRREFRVLVRPLLSDRSVLHRRNVTLDCMRDRV